MNNAVKYNTLFNPDDMLDDVIKKYVGGKITKNDVIFYMEWNDFDMSDIDWKLVEKRKTNN